MSYHRTPAGLIKMPRKSAVAAYLKGRNIVDRLPHRNPKRAALHPGKGIRKAMKRARVAMIRSGRVSTMAAAHELQGWRGQSK